jgi:predicted enzyme related to lactoylglutathione lyase
MAASIVHFEIHASNVERAINFYTKVFDWRVKQWGDLQYWAVFTGRSQYQQDGTPVGMDGGLLPRRGNSPADGAAVNGFVCTIETLNIDATSQAVIDNGGQVVVPKNAIAGIGWQAFCKDTEDNIFGLIQNDQNAA